MTQPTAKKQKLIEDAVPDLNVEIDEEISNTEKTMHAIADRLKLTSSCVDRASSYFKMTIGGRTPSCFPYDAIGRACLYLACSQAGDPRTFKEICSGSSISKKIIGQCYKVIMKDLDTPATRSSPDEFMSRFCVSLKLPQQVQNAAKEIALKAVSLDLVPGRSPVSVAGAAIYLASQASGYKKTPKEIAKVIGMSEMTIRVCYKEMYPQAEDLFPADFHFETPIEELPLQ